MSVHIFLAHNSKTIQGIVKKIKFQLLVLKIYFKKLFFEGIYQNMY